MLGYDSTVPVTMEDMIHHAAAVRRGAPEAFVIGDMPFGSYHTGVRDAVINGLRILKEAGCDAVKLEGGLEMCGVVRGLVEAGISVMGHIGLTPQTAGQLGGYKVQGKDLEAARRLVAEATGPGRGRGLCPDNRMCAGRAGRGYLLVPGDPDHRHRRRCSL